MKTKRIFLPKIIRATGVLFLLAGTLWRWSGATPEHERVATTPADLPSVVTPPSIDFQNPAVNDAMDTHLATVTLASPTHSFLRDWASALQALQHASDASKREKKLESLINGLAGADIPVAVSFLHECGALEINRDLKLRLVRRWAENDPRAVADWISRKSTGSTRFEEIQSVAIVWANQNLSDATAWVRQLADNAERQDGLMALAYEAARIEPIEALRLAVELLADEVRNDLVAHAASQWAARDPEAAAAWANQLVDRAVRERVLANIATAWGESDPVAAGILAVQTLAPGPQQDDAVVGIVQRWVQTEPEQAAAWVTTFPEGTLGQSALENLVKLWADQNWEQAGKWLAGLDLGERRDKAIGTYVCQIMPRLPGTAARWTEDIGDDLLRHQQMETVAEAWMEIDASAARVWITQAALHETTKARLLALNPE